MHSNNTDTFQTDEGLYQQQLALAIAFVLLDSNNAAAAADNADDDGYDDDFYDDN